MPCWVLFCIFVLFAGDPAVDEEPGAQAGVLAGVPEGRLPHALQVTDLRVRSASCGRESRGWWPAVQGCRVNSTEEASLSRNAWDMAPNPR